MKEGGRLERGDIMKDRLLTVREVGLSLSHMRVCVGLSSLGSWELLWMDRWDT